MISVNYKSDDKSNYISLSGHAKYAPMGQDVVCASVSILFLSLLDFLDISKTETKFKEENGGYKAEFERSGETDLIFEFVVAGLSKIAEKYPQNVSITKKI